ncbi:MAG: acidic tetraheme cytochrome c3 TmcA [Solidesulfovibrio sp.]|uniref:acidic tetraheme cytochrome c3 TmcA n=1 Tax=Solidesulfovibrio sp. TaxID=2910990 RepID=UPI002B206B96|nr:cytochrome c3 family protein [Solidesulfovibrio sp.]MEA4855351.1 cytochrome c3 family protein [Solidesulfovibrio sp.]
MKRRTTPLALVALAAALLLAAPAMSQQDMTTVPAEGLASKTRLPAVFPHDQHNEKAAIAECTACHHGEKDGKRDPEADTAGIPCSDCHTAAGKPGRTPLMRAYHKQCMGCHLDKKKGPVSCGDCHKPVK